MDPSRSALPAPVAQAPLREATARPTPQALGRRLLLGGLGLFALGGALAPVGAGCSSAQPQPEPPKACDKQFVTLDILAGPEINPNENGHSRPVVVRLYQLSSDLKLQNARYDDVLLRSEETLGTDVLKMDEVTVFPNDHLQVTFERIPEAAFLAGVALFHQPRGQSWKTFYEFPLSPDQATCGGRGSDAGTGEANPQVTFFVDGAKIDNGSQFDPSMFPNARPVKDISLPKSASPTSGAPATPNQSAPR